MVIIIYIIFLNLAEWSEKVDPNERESTLSFIFDD